MNQPEEVYPNSPLVEAVFMVRFNANLAIDSNKHLLQKRFGQEFPNLAVPNVPGNVEHPLLVPLRFANKEDTELIHFAISSFSYHQKQYQKYSDFKNRAITILKGFMKEVGLETVQQTGLRYVNYIPVLREQGLIPLDRFLNFGYKLPEEIPNRLEKFSTQLVTKLDSGELRTKIALKQLKDPQRTEVIILDFDFISIKQLRSDEIASQMDESHYHTKRIFLNLVTDSYKSVMRQPRNS